MKWSIGLKKQLQRNKFNALSLIIITCVLPHLVYLNRQIVEPHAWRQSQTAWPIWSWLNHKSSLFTNSIPIKGNFQNWPLEIPIVQFIGYLISKITNLSPESSLRIIGIISEVLTWIVLYLIGIKKKLPEKQLITLLVFFALTPYVIWWWGTGLIDLTATAAGVSAIYLLNYCNLQNKPRNIFLILIVAIAISIKPSIAILYSIIATLIYYIKQKKIPVNFISIQIILNLAYLFWNKIRSENIANSDPRTGWTLSSRNFSFLFGSKEQYLNPIPDFIHISVRFLPTVLGLGMSLFLLLAIITKRMPGRIYIYLIATILILYLFINLNFVHDYYQIPLVPIIVYCCIEFLNFVETRYRILFLAICLSLASFGVSGQSKAYIMSAFSKPWKPSIVETLSNVLPQNSRIMMLGFGETPYIGYLNKSVTYMANSENELKTAIKNERLELPFYLVIQTESKKESELLTQSIINKRRNKKIYENIYELF